MVGSGHGDAPPRPGVELYGFSLLDDAKAATRVRDVAEQGNSGAQFVLGEFYSFGVSVKLDHTEALKWYRKAAEQGDVAAQNKLASAYDQAKAAAYRFDTKTADFHV